MDIKQKVVLVTGAASGLGAQTARLLASSGMKVALLDRELETLHKLAAEVHGLALSADVSDSQAVFDAIQTVTRQWGAVHVGVNCAGIISAGRLVTKENEPL